MATKKKNASLHGGDNSVVIGGSVKGSNIVVGNNNAVSNQSMDLVVRFQEIKRAIDKNPDLKPSEKKDTKDELQEIQTELEKPQPDENFLARRFRNIQRMAPDIVDVAFETLKNPASGVATVIQKVAKRMSDAAS